MSHSQSYRPGVPEPLHQQKNFGLDQIPFYIQGSHGHEITGKVLKLENTISSTGNVLE